MSVVACPKCAEKVSLPPKTPPAARVRCPLCAETYLLEEAMSTLPPMLEVLEMPEGYSAVSEDIDISAAAFLASPDRPAPREDLGGEFKLSDEGGVATAEEAAPRYDEWGAVSSTAKVHEADDIDLTPAAEGADLVPTEAVVEPVTRPTLSQTPRKKKKQINPLVHVFGIVMGGVVAIPVALLILLWLPGSLHRDPFNIGPWLGKNAPFLAPSQFHSTGTNTDSNSSNDDGKTPVVASADNKKPEKPNDKGTGNSIQLGSKFEDALKEGTSGSGQQTNSRKVEPEEDPLLGGPADTKPELEPDFKPELIPEPKPKPAVTPDDEPTLEPEKKPVPTPDPDPQPEPEPKPKPEDKPKPEEKPEPTPEPEPEPADSLETQREALTAADKAFNEAPGAEEKKAAAIEMYRVAAELAANLPADAQGAGGLEPLATDGKKRQFVGLYAATWLDDKERTSTGVVLWGNVKSCQAAGDKFECIVELHSKDKRELVVVTKTERMAGEQVFVGGRIVENAKEAIAGYEGEATNAIDARVVHVVGQ